MKDKIIILKQIIKTQEFLLNKIEKDFDGETDKSFVKAYKLLLQSKKKFKETYNKLKSERRNQKK